MPGARDVLNAIRRRLRLPPFADPEKERIAHILRTLIWSFIVGGMTIAANRFWSGYPYVGAALLVGVGAGLFSLWLLYRGWVEQAVFIGLFTLLATITYLLFTGFGIHDISIVLYPIIIVVGGMLLTRRVFILFTLMTILSVAIVVTSEVMGWLETPFDHTFNDFFIISIALLIAAVSTRILTNSLTQSLARSRRQEMALRDSERRLAQHVQNTPIGVIEWTPNMAVSKWNPAATKIFGYTPAEALGRHAFDLIIPDDLQEQLGQTWEEIIGQPDNFHNTNENWTKDRQRIICEWYNTPLVNELGKVIGVASLVQDVTETTRIEAEREQLIAELESKNRELERFTYTVSHDLKSPLVTIRGYLGFMERDLAASRSDRFAHDLAQIREATDKMHLLLNDLLELSRIGRMINPPQVVSFEMLVQEALALVSGQLQGQQVEVSVQPDMPMVYGDRARLVEVLQNLLDNAAKFMGEQSRPLIEIGVTRQQQENLFFVKDNGVGIDPKFHDRIFKLFDRLDPSVDGTGIGLALVKRIIEVHNGRIWVESTGRKEGSTFYFSLPAPPTT